MANVGVFVFKLLHVVLAELAQAEIVSVADDGGRENLGHGDQSDAGRVALGRFGCAGDAVADRLETLLELGIHSDQSTLSYTSESLRTQPMLASWTASFRLLNLDRMPVL